MKVNDPLQQKNKSKDGDENGNRSFELELYSMRYVQGKLLVRVLLKI